MEGVKIPIDPFTDLEQRRSAAVARADFEELQRVIEEARALDGWDDTDPRYAHLINQCVDDIKTVMTYYG